MTQEPLPYLQYATPTADPMPTSVRVIAIIGICLGGLTLLNRLAGVATAIGMLGLMKTQMFGQAYAVYNLVSALVFLAFAAWLLVASIGCLRQKSWGRIWLLRYAVTYPIALIADLLGIIFIVAPGMSTFMARTMATTMTPAATTKTSTTGGVTTFTYHATATTMPALGGINTSSMITAMMVSQAVVSMLVLMVLPTFIFVIMRRPAVREAF